MRRRRVATTPLLRTSTPASPDRKVSTCADSSRCVDPGSLVALLMFVGASVSDLQTRRVPNRYWLPFLFAALALALGRNMAGTQSLDGVLWAAGSAGAMYLFWRFGLFGGADAKGLMVVAALTVAPPDLLNHRTVLALDSLVNATFVMVLLPFGFLAWNLLRGRLALPAGLLGVRMALARAETRHVWPMQEATGDGLRWRYFHRPGTDLVATYAGLRRAGVRTLWVTPKIPFMVPLTFGMVAAVFWGNLALRAMAALLSRS